MSAIFLSHSSEDNAFAEKLKVWLAEQGHRSVFLDFDALSGIEAGRNWEQKLYQELRACRAVIIVCSPHSMASQWCFAEITPARALGKHVFPVKVEACTISSVLADSQVIDFLHSSEEEGLERLKQGLSVAGIDAEDPFDWDGRRPPYPGLLAFQEEDAAIFFGRDDEIGAGLDVLNRAQRFGGSGFVLTLGASGSGKSSLVRAGLLPRLRRDPARWIVVGPLRPGNDPFAELARVFAQTHPRYGEDAPASPYDWTALRDRLIALYDGWVAGPSEEGEIAETSDGNNPMTEMALELRGATKQSEASVLIIIDQFEELLGREEDHLASQFLSMLRMTLDDEHSPVVILATMRSDFLGAFQLAPALLDLTFGEILVGPMSTSSLTDVIEKPAVLAGVQLESGLVRALIDDTMADDALPLLAFTLRELYEKYSSDGILKLLEYRQLLGGLNGSVAKAADGLIGHLRLASTEEQVLRIAFVSMVRINEEGQYARRMARWIDLPSDIHGVLEQFVKARLLVSGGEGQERIVEVAHEALFRAWTTLFHWLEDDREFLLWRRRLAIQVDDWRKADEVPELLIRGSRLAEAGRWLEERAQELTPDTQRFIRTGLEQQDQERLETERRRRWLTNTAAIAALVFLFLGITALYQWRTALQKSQIAFSRDLASNALSQLSIDPELGVLLAREAVERARGTPAEAEAAGVLRQTLLASHVRARLSLPRRLIFDAVFSPDDRLILTASDDNLAQVWAWCPGAEAVFERVRELPGHTAPVTSATFSPDGRLILTTSRDGTARLWDQTPQPRILRGHQSVVRAAAFSPDGTRFVTVGDDGKARLWRAPNASSQPELNTQTEPMPIARKKAEGAESKPVPRDLTGRVVGQHEAPITSTSFSSDGNFLLTTSQDTTARIWNLATGTYAELKGHETPLLSAAFGPESQFVVTASADNTAVVWKRQDASFQFALQDKLIEHADSVTHVAVSPDGRHIATGSRDRTAIVWRRVRDDNWEVAAQFRGHTDAVTAVAFSHDGQFLVTASRDGTARVWQVEVEPSLAVLRGHMGSVNGVTFNPDHNRIVTGGDDNTAQLWTLDVGQQAWQFHSELRGHTDSLSAVQFNADGQHLVTASMDNTAYLWRINTERTERVITTEQRTEKVTTEKVTAERLYKLDVHGDGVRVATFSPDGRYVVTGSNDKTAALWDVSTGKLLHRFGRVDLWPDTYMPRVPEASLFSPDGSYVLQFDGGNAVKLEDAQTQQDLHTLDAHAGLVTSAAFSPDGAFIATSSVDQTVRFWEVETGLPPFDPLEHCAPVSHVSIASNRRLVTQSADHVRRVWIWDDLTEKFHCEPVLSGDCVTECGHRKRIYQAIFSPESDMVLTVGADDTARLWDVQTGEALQVLYGHGGKVTGAAFSPDGALIATSNSDGTVQLWMPSENNRKWLEVNHLVGHRDVISDVGFSPDGMRLITAGHDNKSQIWQRAPDSHDWHQGVILSGHRKALLAAAFSPDSRTVITASKDNTARLWDADTGELLTVLPGHQDWVTGAAFSHDGELIVTTSRDRTARLWQRRRLSKGPKVKTMSCAQDQMSAVAYCDFCGNAETLLALVDACVTRELLASERELYLPTDEHQATILNVDQVHNENAADTFVGIYL